MKIKWICKHCGNPNICEDNEKLVCAVCERDRSSEEVVEMKDPQQMWEEAEARRKKEEEQRKKEEERRKEEERLKEEKRRKEEERRKAEELRRAEELREKEEERRRKEEERRKREEELRRAEERKRREEALKAPAAESEEGKGKVLLPVILILLCVFIAAKGNGWSLLTGGLHRETQAVQEISEASEESEEAEETADIREEFIFWDSDSRYLTDEEVSGLSKEEIRFAINEIYARRGRAFTTPELEEYFSSKSWYTPEFSEKEFSVSVFNQYERANIDLLAKYRKKK